MPSRLTALLCLAVLGLGAGAAVAGDVAAQLSRVLAAQERSSGAASPVLLPLLDRLAGAQYADGDFTRAEAARRRALKIALTSYGGASANTAAAMVQLARLEIEQHRYLDAEPLLLAAAIIVADGAASDGAALADILAAQARVALARGDIEGAERLARRAVDLAPRGKTGASTEPLRALGAVYAVEERFGEGEPLLRQALARDRAAQGESGLEVARSAAQLANLLLRQKRYDEALAPIEQAIAIDQSRLGPTHPLIADDFCDLGLIYDGLERSDDARTALSFAVALLGRGAGKETARVAYAEIELARILRAQGNRTGAEQATDDAHRILKARREKEEERERQI